MYGTLLAEQLTNAIQNVDELRTAILQEWQQFPQERLRGLVQSMTMRVTELHNKRGGYTRY
jgi:hypothetical protein